MQVFLIETKQKISFFKIVNLEDDKITIYSNLDKTNMKRKAKIADKIVKILNNKNCTNVILSKELKQNKDFENLLYSRNIDIIKGRSLFKILLEEIVKKIVQKNKLEKEKTQISICINDYNSSIEELIKKMCKQYKSLNIVTNNIHNFENIKEQVYKENGIIINSTCNKKKALIKSKIIINIDFANELINKYSICDNSIIISVEEPIKIKKKRFNGIIVNDYNIILKSNSNIYSELMQEKYEPYDLKDLAECFIFNYPDEAKNIIIV